MRKHESVKGHQCPEPQLSVDSASVRLPREMMVFLFWFWREEMRPVKDKRGDDVVPRRGIGSLHEQVGESEIAREEGCANMLLIIESHYRSYQHRRDCREVV